MENYKKIITIDGPAGSGKSLMAKNLAQALGWLCLDTGAIYRAVALIANERGISPTETKEAGNLAETLDLRLYCENSETLVIVGDRDVTGLLRSPEVSRLSSQFSAIPAVREALLNIQRRLGEKGHLVTEGRDMGSIVFPWAALKFFLTAKPEVRAGRRQQQLAREGVFVDLESILADITTRDYSDSNRSTAQLGLAQEGAIIIDSTSISAFEVETIMIGEAKRVFGL
ncbi:MAG: (d)CMP kinase [Deltaproteobacteria bacterium]|jgi:cytidylate kinase|nr:(d)CMP kinase [Deltaproteobacteria bacterium]